MICTALVAFALGCSASYLVAQLPRRILTKAQRIDILEKALEREKES